MSSVSTCPKMHGMRPTIRLRLLIAFAFGSCGCWFSDKKQEFLAKMARRFGLRQAIFAIASYEVGVLTAASTRIAEATDSLPAAFVQN